MSSIAIPNDRERKDIDAQQRRPRSDSEAEPPRRLRSNSSISISGVDSTVGQSTRYALQLTRTLVSSLPPSPLETKTAGRLGQWLGTSLTAAFKLLLPRILRVWLVKRFDHFIARATQRRFALRDD